jgi:hypothetical protein
MLWGTMLRQVHVPVCGECGRKRKEDDVAVREIWKYELPHTETELELPFGAEVVHADDQRNRLCVWIMIDPLEEAMETRRFRVVTTGERFFLNEVRGKIRTVLMRGGSYVAHVFEVE